MAMICPLCLLEVKEHPCKMIACEKPYLNIFFHIDCYRKVEYDLTNFITANIEIIQKNFNK